MGDSKRARRVAHKGEWARAHSRVDANASAHEAHEAGVVELAEDLHLLLEIIEDGFAREVNGQQCLDGNLHEARAGKLSVRPDLVRLLL